MAEKPDGSLTVVRGISADGRLSGRLLKIVWDKNYGFIRAAALTSDGDYRDFFFHQQALEDPEDWLALAPGDRMSFVPEDTAKGPRALKVRKEG